MDETLPNVGESWEVSAVEGSESVVANGADKGYTLPEMVRKYKDELVGEANYARFGSKLINGRSYKNKGKWSGFEFYHSRNIR